MPMKFGLILATDLDDPNLNNLAPIGLGCIAASVKKYLPDVEVVLTERPADMIAEKPDVIGISATTEYYYIACHWAKRFKEALDIPVIIGGIHISLLPESMTEDFDVAVIGEGDLTIIDLLQSLIKYRGVNRDHLRTISGLFFYDTDGTPRHTPPRPLIQDLDSLPRVDWSILPFYKEYDAHIVSARGCPYKCSFCASEKFARQHRFHSADSIVREIEYFVVEKGLGYITFYDDLLIANKKRLATLIDKLKERGLLGKCRYFCQVRANLVTEDICGLLNTLDAFSVGIGIESFSDPILKYYNKTGITGTTNQRAIDLLHQAGIIVNPSIIFGAPPETREDMLVTLRAIYRNLEEGKLESPAWTLLRPYPGTVIWREAARRGLVSNDMDWEQFSNWGSYDLYMCDHVSKEEFQELIGEWRAKISLANFDRIGAMGGNFVFDDRNDILPAVLRHRARISGRPAAGAEPGDDILARATPAGNGKALLLNGWHEEENGSRWIGPKATAILTAGPTAGVRLRGYIPPEIWEAVHGGTVTVSFYNEGRELSAREYTLTDHPDGLIEFFLPAEPSSALLLTITVNKSFVPRLVSPGSQDDRELAMVVTLPS